MMTTTMRPLPVRVTDTVRQLIDAVGPVNPATRALVLLGADAAGLDLHGCVRDLRMLLASELDPQVQRAVSTLLARLAATPEVPLPPSAAAPRSLDAHSDPDGDGFDDDPFARVGIAV